MKFAMKIMLSKKSVLKPENQFFTNALFDSVRRHAGAVKGNKNLIIIRENYLIRRSKKSKAICLCHVEESSKLPDNRSELILREILNAGENIIGRNSQNLLNQIRTIFITFKCFCETIPNINFFSFRTYNQLLKRFASQNTFIDKNRQILRP